MNLQGRNLSIEMVGEDVAILQSELAELGYQIDPAEAANKHFGNSTRDAVALVQRRHDRAFTGVVDEETARLINAEVDARRKIEGTVVPTVPLPPIVTVPAAPPASPPPAPPSTDQSPADQQYVVRGQVRQADGSVLAGALVRAVDKDLRHEQMLGEATTDREGSYAIRYTLAQFKPAEAETADLIVRVYGQNGEVLVASPVLFNVPREVTINLMVGGGVYRGPSEYERFVAALTLVLDGALLAELTDDDVTFLAGETGINAQYIHFIVVAQHLAGESNLPPEIFYGFAREGLPTELTPLLAVHANIQRSALQRAVRDNIIPMRFGNEVEAILERLRQLMISQAFVYPNATGAVPLGALLATSGLSRQLIERLHTLYTQHVGSIPDFWAALQKDPDFSQDGRVETLRFTMQISSIAHGYVPLVQALQDMRRAGSIKSARDLAGADENDWLRLIQRQMNEKGAGFPADVPGANDKERASNYARMLTSAVEAQFPAAVVARRVVRGRRPGTEDLARFFTNNPDFDLGSTHIETYLAAHPRTALAGVANPTRLVEQLKSTQRIFKVTPHYDEMQVLLAAGHDSALSIVHTGQSSFVAAHAQALGPARAAQIFAQADRAASLALGIFTQYSLAFNRTPVAGLPSIAGPTASQFLSSTGPSDGGMSSPGPSSSGGDSSEGPGASLPTLFGSLDFCGCDECRSIYSPAAYLVDILHFLSDAAQKMLLASDRRQDIGEIELSCANTTRLLPYVDLVNEVLERAVAQDGNLTSALPPKVPWPQTTWTADELRANPEHWSWR